ncbi:MAG TPA: protease complex subunit PrcB family protein [Bacillus bacterium]|nr:protease complex subunit PrcB family protein [Bacillus sp. (in: firmicutes)]
MLLGLSLLASNTVSANEQPVVIQENIAEKKNEYLHFTPVTLESLSEAEKAFVEHYKFEKGVHRKDTLYLISLGEKPNPGYQLEFVKSETTWEQEQIFVRQLLPKEGYMYPQVIHYPYIIGRLQLPSKYMTINVIDIDSGEEIFQKEQIVQPIDNKAIKVYINGRMQVFDQPPLLKDGRTMVPLRGIFESLGAQVQYDETTGMITATKEKLIIKLKVFSKEVNVNGQTKIIDAAPFAQNGRALVPLRFIGETLGENVKWDAEQNTVYIVARK